MATLNEVLGNIKRKYPEGDFNPFKTMEYIYQNCLHSGVGNTVLIVGYSDRFVNEIITAWRHVLISEGLLKNGDDIPNLSPLREFKTHTGTVLRFEVFKDSTEHQMKFYETCKECQTVALCNEYKSPEFLNVIREMQSDRNIYDFSKNNEKTG